MVYDAIRLCQSVQKESKRTAAQDVRSRIREMQQAKDEMVQVFELVKQLSVFMGVPFVSSYITMYAAIFSKLGNLCDKIAGYALKIAEETEKSFGGFQRALNDPNSIISHNMKYYLEEDRKAHR
jgi:hypothetical protein